MTDASSDLDAVAARSSGALMTRRTLLAGTAAGVLAGCASPFEPERAENAFPPIGEFVETSKGLVHAWRAGPSDPALAARTPVVLIHGASGNLRDFTYGIAPRIAETRPVIAVDRPGFGYTDRPEGAEHPSIQAAMLREAAIRLGAERPHVLGHSYGAAVSMAWAVEAPGNIAGVVPVSGVTMPYGGLGRVFSALGISGVVTWAYTQYLKSIAEDGGVERFLARVFRPQSPPPGYAAYVGAPLALRESTLQANSRDLQEINSALFDLAPRYGELSVPAEIVHGSADFIEPDGQAIPLKGALPQARLTLLPNVGHMAHHVAPDVLIAALDRLDAADRA